MQNASLSTLTKSSHQRQKNSLKSKSSLLFLKCWCKHVEHSSANPMKRYAKNEKKNSDLKYKKSEFFLPIVTFLSTSSSGHVKCSFHNTGETLSRKVHRRFTRGPKTLRKVTICSEKNVSSKKSSRHAECKVVIPDESFSPSWRRKKLLAKVKKKLRTPFPKINNNFFYFQKVFSWKKSTLLLKVFLLTLRMQFRQPCRKTFAESDNFFSDNPKALEKFTLL